MPKNVAGHVVRGEDFWGRRGDVAALWARLEGDDVLLPGPRRLGKSSLMAALLDEPRPGWTVVYMDVYPIDKPEEFLIELTAALVAADPIRRVMGQIRDAPGRFAGWIRGVIDEVGLGLPDVGEVKLKLRDRLPTAGTWDELAADLLTSLRRVEGKVLLIVDEFPSMVATMLAADRDGALRMLRWLRTRRGPAGTPNVRFLLGGSVNLQPLLEEIGQEKHINDLDRFELRPFCSEAACEFVAAVLQAEGVEQPQEPAQRIVEIAATGVPFFLQVFIRECLEEARHRRTTVHRLDLRAVFRDRVMGPAGRARFSHYLSRLREAYGAQELAARTLLWEVATRERASLDHLREALDRGGHSSANLRPLLVRLQSDHYLVVDGPIVTFTSGFLREWWLRNAVPGASR